jgi:uncharacterized OB-fold protein
VTELPTSSRSIDDGLLELRDGQPVLIGSRCTECGTVAFPAEGSCARCTCERTERHELARSGVLWTWTTQGFRPKTPPYMGPAEFVGYGVGYVELGGEIRVEGILTEADPSRLRIGMPMALTTVPATDAGGVDCVTFAFAPTEDS